MSNEIIELPGTGKIKNALPPKQVSNIKWIHTVGSGIYQQAPSNVNSESYLPVGTYFLRINPDTGNFFVEKTSDFSIPDKVYGDCTSKISRIMKQFEAENANLGVLLCGLKGTGKSMTAKMLCSVINLPVIIIDKDYTAAAHYKSFVMNIAQEVVFFFDEFEKKFAVNEGQSRLLSLVEGIATNKHLYLFTANIFGKINQYFYNRPGRIRYLWKYRGLTDEEVVEIVDDLLAKDVIHYYDELVNIFGLINDGKLNYDRVVSFIKEINIHKLPPSQLIKGFNMTADMVDKHYELEIKFKVSKTENIILKASASANFLDFQRSGGRIQITGTMIDNIRYMFKCDYEDYIRIEDRLATDLSILKAFVTTKDSFKAYASKEARAKGEKILDTLVKQSFITAETVDDIKDYQNYYRNITCDWCGYGKCVKANRNEIIYELEDIGVTFIFKPSIMRTISSINYD